MPLKSVTLSPAQLVHVCMGLKPDGTICNTENTIALGALTLGLAGAPTGPDKNMIVTPACTGCGAPSFYVRTWDTTPDEYAATPHVAQRKAVNALAKWLKDNGQVHASVQAAVQAETSDSPEIAALPLASVLLPLAVPPSGRGG